MKYDYVLYVDEAGDTGLRKLRTENEEGSSEWFVLSGVLIRAENERYAKDNWRNIFIDSIKPTNRTEIHFSKLNDKDRLSVSTVLSKINSRLFVICSNKNNMVGYKNQRAEKRSGKNTYYNFCIRVLLERVTSFCEYQSNKDKLSKPKIKIIFSRAKGFSYSQMKSYIKLLEMQSKSGNVYLNKRVPVMKLLDWQLIEHHNAKTLGALDAADILASSFYQALNSKDDYLCEPAKTLRRTLYTGEKIKYKQIRSNKTYVQEGLTILPWRYSNLPLNENQKSFFNYFGFNYKI